LVEIEFIPMEILLIRCDLNPISR
jgi:hypothetical protein